MKKKIITLGTILFLYSTNSAQYIPKILPPSPNATSIAKFVESPVSYYRGSANVNIPLFNVQTADLSINISIQYDTKGVRVGEIASSVGAGWSLNAGGLITRQVRQRPDEYIRGYLTYSYNAAFDNNTTLRQQLVSENASYSSSDTPVDEDPDLFFINFLGRSAKFIIDNVTKKAIVQNFDDWKIDIDYEDANTGNFRINKIVITDEQGNKYYFGKDSSDVNSAYDIVTSISSKVISPASAANSPQESGYKTAWHLMEVKTQKVSCLFNYVPEQVTTYSKSDLNTGDNIGSISLSTTKTTQQILQNISFPEGKFEFVYNAMEREDLKGGKSLNAILLKDKRDLQIKKMSFVQSYRPGNGNNNNIHPLILQEDLKSDKRLFLNQINEVGTNEGIILSYKFEYNPKELPNRHSNSIDYWGYFNGKLNNMNIFTDVKDGNRDVYGIEAEAGILTKIIYPAGGSENFYYEDNNAVIPSYFSNFILANPSRNLYDDKTTAIAKGSEYFVLNNGSTTRGKYIKEFEISGVYKKKFSYTALLGPICISGQTVDCCTSVETTGCKTKVRLQRFDKNTGAILATYTITQGNNIEIINPPIENGNYRLEVSNMNFTLSDSENMETNPFSVVLHWTEYKPNVPLTSFVGGGRRVSIIEMSDNGQVTKRKFTYTLDNGMPSGKLLGIPDYMCIIKKYGDIPMVAGQLLNRIQPMSSFNNAGQVGYSQITESFLSSGNAVLWTKKYNFSNYPDGGDYYKFPYHLPDDMEWARGLNLKTTSYDSTGKMVETLENKYNFSGEEFSPYRFYKMSDGTIDTNAPNTELIPLLPSQAPSNYLFTHYVKSIPIYKWSDGSSNQSPDIYRTAFFYSGMIKNYQKIKTEYENGLPVKVTYIDTANESLIHHQNTSEKTTYSDKAIQEIKYQYAHEKNNQKLINANMVAIPLETTVIKKQNTDDPGKIISKIETKYDNPITLLPTSVLSYDLQDQSILTTEITYDQYDSKGNLQQYTTKDGISTVIIWGYNQTQPIAKIENAKLADIGQSFITAIVNASNTDASAGANNDETNLLNAFNTFRGQLSGYKITTYSYDPLIGVRSITPPSGIREVYVYDAANRLKEIRENSQTGNLLKEVKYNYKQ
ncbi:hypothetical protein EGY07_12310 [Chryseobacterium indologenes]|uniref:hypothetical protein n=1 Tax=Chryseobacterium indologenes TaxID=253 RepID=UPI000F4D9F8A|nr:hypothetical protein [Chryseobacterium indologenes]AYZ36304.1 hypothetical protein EGY07_12310 [Chryseobacterium indologenes]MEB4759229.1 hypothetical protein [Chryseobacterium indologenes]